MRTSPNIKRCLLSCLWMFILAVIAQGTALHAQSTPEIFVRRGHRQAVNSIVFSPGGHLLASCGAGNDVRVWNAHSGQLLYQFGGGSSIMSFTAFSPDGRWLVSGGEDKKVTFRHAATGTVVSESGVGQSLTGGLLPYTLTAGVFSPDGKKFAASNMLGFTAIFDMETFSKTAEVNLRGTNYLMGLCYDASGTILYGLRSGGDIIGIPAEGGSEFPIGKVKGFPYSLQCTADGNYLVAVCDSVYVFDLKAKKLHASFGGSSCALTGAGSNLSLYIGQHDGNLTRVFPAEGRKQLLPMHTGIIYGVGLSPDGRWLATGTESGVLRIWDAETFTLLRSLEGGASPVSTVAVSADGNTLAVGLCNREVSVLSLRTLSEGTRLVLPGDLSSVFFAAADQKICATSNGSGMAYASLPLFRPGKKTYPDKAAALEPAADEDIQYYLLPDGKVCDAAGKTSASLPPLPVQTWMISSAQSVLAAYPDRLELKSLGSNARSAKWVLPDSATNLRCFLSPDQKLAVIISTTGRIQSGIHWQQEIDVTNEVTLLSIPDLKVVKRFFPHAEYPEGNGHVRLGTQCGFFLTEKNALLLGMMDGSVLWYDLGTLTFSEKIALHDGVVTCIDFRAPGTLVTGSLDGTVMLYDLSTRKTLLRYVAGAEGYALLRGNYYLSPEYGLDAIGVRYLGREHSTRAFDLSMNRPDLVGEMFGADPAMIDLSKRMVNLRPGGKRDLAANARETYPSLNWDHPDFKVITTDPSVSLPLLIKASANDTLYIQINHVPQSSQLLVQTGEKSVTLSLPLSDGPNEIEMFWRTQQDGALVPALRTFVWREAAGIKPNLYFLGVAVTRFDHLPALPNVTTDVRDLVSAFTQREGDLFGSVSVDTLFGNAFAPGAESAFRQKIKAARAGDIILIYYGGHGVLGEDLRYYLATSGFDPQHPVAGDVVMEDWIADILANCPAQNRLALINACHGGEASADQKTFEAMRLFFADVRETQGESVIAGSRATEQALAAAPGAGSNTAFGRALLEVLAANKPLTVTDLLTQLNAALDELTYGEQHPVMRRKNALRNFRIW